MAMTTNHGLDQMPDVAPRSDIDCFDPTPRHYREALDWFLKLREKDLDTNPLFEKWKASDPSNEYAFAEVEALFSSSARVTQEAEYYFRPRQKPNRVWRRWMRGGFALAASFVLFLAVPPIPPLSYMRADATTGAGEMRQVRLKDGSLVTLNTRSAIKTDLDDKDRNVTLLGGEAFFDVAKDPSRPFRIKAGVAGVEVLGTKFNVHIEDGQTRISVVQGHVKIYRASNPENAVLLTPGQAADVSESGIARQSTSTSDLAWRNRELVFSYTPLRKVVHELNRYRVAPIYITDGSLGSSMVVGVFRTDAPDDAVRIIQRNLGMRSINLPTGHTFLY
jgi:transmembrane sensor